MNESKRRRLAEMAQPQPNGYDEHKAEFDALCAELGLVLMKYGDAARIRAMMVTIGMLISLKADTLEQAADITTDFTLDLRDIVEHRWPFFEAHKASEAQKRMGERAMAEAMDIEGMTEQ
jgi:hypothetical protein